VSENLTKRQYDLNLLFIIYYNENMHTLNFGVENFSTPVQIQLARGL
jgi:hypothetical protein